VVIADEKVQIAFKEANELKAIFLKSSKTANPVRLSAAGQAIFNF
jgi:hypothetical protein